MNQIQSFPIQEIEQRLAKLENKINLILEQQQSTQKAIAHLRGEVARK